MASFPNSDTGCSARGEILRNSLSWIIDSNPHEYYHLLLCVPSLLLPMYPIGEDFKVQGLCALTVSLKMHVHTFTSSGTYMQLNIACLVNAFGCIVKREINDAKQKQEGSWLVLWNDDHDVG